MYKVGNYVVKDVEGVCKIVDIKPLEILRDSDDKFFLHLVPIENPGVTLYLPQDTACNKVRPLLNEEEVLGLISEIPDISPVDITDEKHRDKIYKNALMSGDCRQLVSVIKSIYTQNQQRISQGKKSRAMEEYYFKAAEEKLYSELSLILKKDKESVKKLIIENCT